MDEADQADSYVSRMIRLGVLRSQSQNEHPLTQPKACLNCGEPIAPQFLCLIPRRWCDADCRNDWEAMRR